MGMLKSFVEGLERILREPPYLIFLFIGSVFVAISLGSEHYFKESWAFFLYACVGSTCRYIEKDYIRQIEKKRNEKNIVKLKILVISIYHLLNFSLIFGLFKYLGYL